MIRVLDTMPDGVVGLELEGRVEGEDYRTVVEPALAAALAGRDKVRLLAVLGEGFEGYSAGAAWEDAKVGLGHWSDWERIAVVTDHKRIAEAIGAMGWLVPGEVKVFPTAGQEQAVAWLTPA